MNAIQKFIRDAIIRCAKAGEALTIDSLVEGSGVDHDRVITELSLFVRMGLLDAPGDLTKATAIQMKRLTAHGEVIHQGKLEFARDTEGEVIHLQLESGGAAALTIGDDTYHVGIEPSGGGDGTYILKITECASTDYATLVFVESGFADEATACARADQWLRQREEEGYRWEFGMEDHPLISAMSRLVADVALIHTPDALPPYRLAIVYQHEDFPSPNETIQQDFSTAEDAWAWWAQTRRALIENVYIATLGSVCTQEPMPEWTGPHWVDADMLDRCKNGLSFRAVRDGGVALPPIAFDNPGVAGGKWVCSQILPGSIEGVILFAVLSHVVPNCEGTIKFKEDGEGYIATGTQALLVLDGYREASEAAATFLEAQGFPVTTGIPVSPATDQTDEPADEPATPQPTVNEVQAPAKEDDEPDFPF